MKRELKDRRKRMEKKEGIGERKGWGEERGVRIYKVGMKQEVVEVDLI